LRATNGPWPRSAPRVKSSKNVQRVQPAAAAPANSRAAAENDQTAELQRASALGLEAVCTSGGRLKQAGTHMEPLLITLLIGAIAGWLAGVIVKGYGFGLLGNIVVGILGAFVGNWLFGTLGLFAGGGIIGAIAGATIGAVVLLLLLRLVRRAA
jgi:uncharacterized membrane protein YeaQ/YmgE (transglycosylase-associated protein family)